MNGIVQTEPEPVTSSRANGEGPGAEMSTIAFEDISQLERLLRVAKFELTQTGRGPLRGQADCLHVGGTRLVREIHRPAMVWTTAFEPQFVVFALPIRWEGELAYNGEPVRRGDLFRFSDPGGYFGRNAQGGREVISAGLSRQTVLETLAMLRGVDADDVEIGNGALPLGETTADWLRATLAQLIDDTIAHPDVLEDALLVTRRASDIETLLLDALAAAMESSRGSVRSYLYPSKIVRRVEEYFLESPHRKVSLADLCAAAGVSAPTLYKAFDAVCDITPLKYLRLRRLSLARSTLRKATPHRGIVKDAALGLGLTELGRFAVEYRALFGETPSATLHRGSQTRSIPLDAV
jgi:AraC-like DNA-binding protein